MQLYAREIILRNCGRFFHVSSDFGSEYKTHAFLSSEMLYAGLSRERTRKPRSFSDAMSSYDFFRDFQVQAWPVWFTTAMLIDTQTHEVIGKRRQDIDTHVFNSLQEGRPGIQENSRLPKFGSIETILPNRRFSTLALSLDADLLLNFQLGQVFCMGKKRTMFQIAQLTEIMEGTFKHTSCITPFLQIRPQDSLRFQRFQIIAGTQRYMVLRGETHEEAHWEFTSISENGQNASGIPQFAIEEFLNCIESI